MSAVTVRAAAASDAEALAALHVDAWRETYSGLLPERFFGPDARAARVRMWTDLLSRDPAPGPIAVAERDGDLLGFAYAGVAAGPDAEKDHAPARDLQLHAIYVLAAAHGSGIGQHLLDAVLGDRPAQLWVAQGNPRAIRFYERNGFRRDGVQYVDPDLSDLVEVRMVR